MTRSKIPPALALGAAMLMTLSSHAGRGSSATYLAPTGPTFVGSITATQQIGIGGFAFTVEDGETSASVSLIDATGAAVGGTYATDVDVTKVPFCGSADVDVTDAKTFTVTADYDSALTCGSPATTGTINVDFA